MGVVGCGLIKAGNDDEEIQPLLSVTVNMYETPEGNPVKLPVVPDEFNVRPPGELVTVQVPIEGSPLNATVPVDIKQVGWVIVPITGGVGVYKLMAALLEKTEVHPAEFVTENV